MSLQRKNRALIRGLYMVYGFKRGNTPGFIPLVYIPYTFSKRARCLHNRFAMLARAQTTLNPRPIEAGIQATPMARRFGLWLNQIAAALSTRRRRESDLARERRVSVFERGCAVRRSFAPSPFGCTVHRWSGRFAPNAPFVSTGHSQKTLPSPLCRRQHIHANRGRQCGADGLDSFMRLIMRDGGLVRVRL